VFFILRTLGLLDTYPGVIIPGLADVFGVFLMKQSSRRCRPSSSMPRVSMARRVQVYTRIILPLSKPALAVLAIFTFNRYWNAFIFPLVILRDPAKYPVQVGLATLQGEFNTDFGMLMTGAAVAAIPMIVVFFAFQRYFMRASAWRREGLSVTAARLHALGC